MELRNKEYGPPPCNALPIRRGERIPKDQETAGIEGAEDGPDDELSMLEPRDRDKRLADTGEQNGADKSTRHGAREGEVVVGDGEALRDVTGGSAVDEDVVGGLEVEGLLDFGVGRDEEVDEGDDEEERAELDVFVGLILR